MALAKKMLMSHVGVPGFRSQVLPASAHPGRQLGMAPVLGPCLPHGRPELRAQLLASAWPNPNNGRHVGNEPQSMEILFQINRFFQK